MALIKCPACGNTVSENALSCPHCGEPIKASRMSGEIVSGTEIFHVEAGNRLELSAKVDAEVSARTARLSSEGKNVINIQKSNPQPFTLGVTVWKMDVTLIWNASLDSPTYKQTIYNEAKSYQLSGQYSKAAALFEKISGFSDANSRKTDCLQKENAQAQAAYDAYTKHVELVNAIGDDPSSNKAIYYGLWCVPMFFGFIMVAMSAQYYDLNKGIFWFGMIMLVSSILACIIRAIKISKYEQKKSQYEQSKKASYASMTTSTKPSSSFQSAPTNTTVQNRLEAANLMYTKGNYKSAKSEYQTLLKYYYSSFDDSTTKIIKEKIDKCSEHLNNT